MRTSAERPCVLPAAAAAPGHPSREDAARFDASLHDAGCRDDAPAAPVAEAPPAASAALRSMARPPASLPGAGRAMSPCRPDDDAQAGPRCAPEQHATTRAFAGPSSAPALEANDPRSPRAGDAQDGSDHLPAPHATAYPSTLAPSAPGARGATTARAGDAQAGSDPRPAQHATPYPSTLAPSTPGARGTTAARAGAAQDGSDRASSPRATTGAQQALWSSPSAPEPGGAGATRSASSGDARAGVRAHPSHAAATPPSTGACALPTHGAGATPSPRVPDAADAPGGSRPAPAHRTTMPASAHSSGPAPHAARAHEGSARSRPAGATRARTAVDERPGDGTPPPPATALPAMPGPPGSPGRGEPRATATARAHPAIHATPTRIADKRRAEDAARDGVPLQTLLAAAHPLAAAVPPAGDAVVAPSSTAPALTPHDVAASVQGAWLRETRLPAAGGVASQWTFALGDPLTPLAALRISTGADGGWALQLTAGQGLPASELAAHVDRLRQRLRARGQAVERLDVDDDTENAS